jgi:hypothetical protein
MAESADIECDRCGARLVNCRRDHPKLILTKPLDKAASDSAVAVGGGDLRFAGEQAHKKLLTGVGPLHPEPPDSGPVRGP